jgi:general secretion pathway protein E
VTTSLQAALTGHLVLSSVHANDAVGVLFRLMDLEAEPASISATLIGIVAQRMVRRICTHCRAPHQPSPEEMQAINGEAGEADQTFFHGTGCNLCAGTGYRGRTGIFELLVMSEPIREMLRDRAGAGEIKAQAVAEGMTTMKQDGVRKAREGITSISEVIRSVFSIT